MKLSVDTPARLRSLVTVHAPSLRCWEKKKNPAPSPSPSPHLSPERGRAIAAQSRSRPLRPPGGRGRKRRQPDWESASGLIRTRSRVGLRGQRESAVNHSELLLGENTSFFPLLSASVVGSGPSGVPPVCGDVSQLLVRTKKKATPDFPGGKKKGRKCH